MDYKEYFNILERGKIMVKLWELDFFKSAKTSRDILLKHPVHFVQLFNEYNVLVAISECAPIMGLSKETAEEVSFQLKELSNIRNKESWDYFYENACSSVRFCMELLFQSFLQSDIFKPFGNSLELNIPVNGLVWMNDDAEVMLDEAMAKWKIGFTCIKFKVGALNFDQECKMIGTFRDRVGKDVQIRLDANGAWDPVEAHWKLRELSQWNIHSIEQPIKKGNAKEMKKLVEANIIPIALDEELIGVDPIQIEPLLNAIQPHYIVLKPSLHGGFSQCENWIQVAESLGISWWVTSALESNIALNGIARWVSKYNNAEYQGLGTGSLYSNNWEAPLTIVKGNLCSQPTVNWRAPW